MAAMVVTGHVAYTRFMTQPAHHHIHRRFISKTHLINLNVGGHSHSTRDIIITTKKLLHFPFLFITSSSTSRIKNSQTEDAENTDAASSKDTTETQASVANQIISNEESKNTGTGFSFLAKLAVALGIAATITLISVGLTKSFYGSFHGVNYLTDGSSTSLSSAPSVGFTINVFGKTVVLPQYPPGWVYFWLLMAAGCGLLISEEALNIWVGISLSRLLSLDGTWSSFIESFSRNGPYIISTVLWVYWGVCISDMVPFYLGKLLENLEDLTMFILGFVLTTTFSLGIGKDKATNITRVVQRYGNLIGFVERFSLGVRNPTAFLAGALDISPEYFFAGVCCGGLVTLPVQLAVGFLLRERPVFALATVASVVGIWTLLPYAIAASTALFLYLRSRLSS